MTDKPRWQELQEEWNLLVPAAQAAGIPRIRAVKIGAEAIKYREERLATLKSQLSAAGVKDLAEAAQAPEVTLDLKPGSVTARHDLPLADFDVTVWFADGSSEVFFTQARDALSAIAVASYSVRVREWTAERLRAIQSITWSWHL